MFQFILAASQYTKADFWLPDGASTVASDVDFVYYFVYWVSVIFFVLVAAMTLIFAIQYRHKKGRTVESGAGHSTALELTWTIIPTLIVVVIFYYGFRGYLALAVEPPRAYEITVNGKMWNWSFIYPNGYVSNELHIPANTPIRFILTSDDVIHSFYIPDFRTKKDVVPGRFNRLWVNALREHPENKDPEVHDVYCAEYCGTNHSMMLSKAWVHDKTEFPAWLEKASNWANSGTISYVQQGETIYKQRGCAQCHSVNGTVITGPTWKDMAGSEVPLSDGRTVIADEAYLRESILYPAAKVVKGFNPVMPSYQGTMKEQDITAVIAYMKSISPTNYKGTDLPLLKQPAKATPEGLKTAK